MMPPEDMPTPVLLRLVYNSLVTHVYETVRAHAPGLRPAHGNVLEQFDYADGLRLTDLAKGAGMTPQSIGELVDQLEALGFVERRPDPDDRRAKRIYLTAQARRYQKHARRGVAEIEQSIADELGERGRAGLRRALIKLVNAAGPQR